MFCGHRAAIPGTRQDEYQKSLARVTFSVALYDHYMPSPLVLLIYTLAVARLTMVVTKDEISRPIRKGLVRRFCPEKQSHRLIVYLLGDAEDGTADGCPWCVSIWIGMLSAPLLWMAPTSPYLHVPLAGLAASQVTGMIFKIGRQ